MLSFSKLKEHPFSSLIYSIDRLRTIYPYYYNAKLQEKLLDIINNSFNILIYFLRKRLTNISSISEVLSNKYCLFNEFYMYLYKYFIFVKKYSSINNIKINPLNIKKQLNIIHYYYINNFHHNKYLIKNLYVKVKL